MLDVRILGSRTYVKLDEKCGILILKVTGYATIFRFLWILPFNLWFVPVTEFVLVAMSLLLNTAAVVA